MLSTIQKINLAKISYYFVMLVRKLLGRSLENIKTTRSGIRWGLDLKEGIDFSIYILGGFEPSTLRLYKKLVKQGDVVLDIGANIGSHTLPLARLVGDTGHIYAFEPTDFAIKKLHSNLNLNTNLIDRVTVCQVMLVANKNTLVEKELFSSWPLVGEGNKGLHEKHRGQLMATTGAYAETLDNFVKEHNFAKIDFIKLDVDGFEYSVLSGGKETFEKFRPVILMELAPYLFKNQKNNFIQMIKFYKNIGYFFYDANNKNILPMDAEKLFDLIPDGVSRNIIATAVI